MDEKRKKELERVPRADRRKLKELLVAELVCAALSLESYTPYRISRKRPTPPESHDFDAKRQYRKETIAIEVTEFTGTNLDHGILDPEKESFWYKLKEEVEKGLRGKLPGTFIVHGGPGQFPNIPGEKRGLWVKEAQDNIIAIASTLKVGEKKPLGSPPEIANMELEKCSDQGAKVSFCSTPITSGLALPHNAIEYFCSTTLMEKNKGALATAKKYGKKTVLAIVAEYYFDTDGLRKEVRCKYLKRQIPNIDHVYMVNCWQPALLIKVF